MNLKTHLKQFVNQLGRQTTRLIILIYILLLLPTSSIALDSSTGEFLFKEHCAGCHINGGNIIRRNKTLRLKALERYGLDNPEAIARVAREGIGQMSGYENVLGEGGDQLVAIWIWAQAQKAWIQG
ncbi:MAG: c-type cytochrome [Prochlorococcus sp.]|jgi:cytochrome c6|nr:c-type cytochrome [Prochlorococcaceae cyanobacterium ETNP18_MAG_14]